MSWELRNNIVKHLPEKSVIYCQMYGQKNTLLLY